MMDVEEIFQTIRGLPIRDRLRLVERVVHELADTSSIAEPACAEPSPVGLFADDPDEVDEMMKIVMENRRHWKLRSVEGDGEQGPA
jgi:hypothetical protein